MRTDDRRRGAVGNGGAHQQCQRIDDDARLNDFLDRERAPVLGERVERAVVGILHGGLGEVADRPAILVHPRLEIDLGVDRVAGRELHSHFGELELRYGAQRADGARRIPTFIFSTPTASATSAAPDATSSQAPRSAVIALAQAFSTLTMGMPVMPECARTTWPRTPSCPVSNPPSELPT